MTTHRRLRGCVRILLLLTFAGCLFTTSVQAQNRQSSGLPAPRVWQINPSGGKVGTSFEVVVAGRHLEEAQKLSFSNPGIKAELVAEPKPEIDSKTKKPKPVKGALPADHVKFKVTIPPGTPLGNVDCRLVNKWGASNARAFVVGDLDEVEEKEPNNDVEQAQKVALNSTVNGTMSSPTDVDYFLITAKKGQRVVVSCPASSIDSRFQPGLEIYDLKDNQLAANRTYQNFDAVTDFIAPEDGDYLIRLFVFTHTFRQAIPGNMPAGSSDNFYRLSVSTAPWIDAVVPPVVEPGKTASVTIYGRNLPGGKVDPSALMEDTPLEKITMNVTAPADAKGKLLFSGSVAPAMGWQDGFELRVKNATGSSNPFFIGLAQAPVVLEAANNDKPESAQEVSLPCEIAGQVEKRADRDWYTFTAKKGEVWNIEVLSHRLGAPTYMMMMLRNPTTKSDIYESPLNDNMQRYSPKFYSRSEDPPAYRFTVPADGKYQLLVVSRAGDTVFGARHTYTVRITRDQPDFRLIALGTTDSTPDVTTVLGGGCDAFTVMAERTGEYQGDIELTVEGLPAGVTCPPQTLAGGVRKTTLVLQGNPGLAPWAGEVRIKGTAVINGNKVTHEARPAGVIWPMQNNSNSPALARVERSLWISTRDKAPFSLMPSIDKAEILQGDKATVKIKVNRLWPDLKAPMQITLMQNQGRQGSEIPTNLRFTNVINVNAGQAEGTMPVTVGADVPPGVYNIVFRGQTQGQYNKDPKSKARPNTTFVQPSAPLRLSVLPKSLATLNLSTAGPSVKIGGQTDLVVRVQRKYGFTGEFKVQLIIPGNVKGIEAGEVTIPANQDEVKLVLKAQGNTNPGNRPNLVVRATAMWNGKTPTVHEAKLNINVVK